MSGGCQKSESGSKLLARFEKKPSISSLLGDFFPQSALPDIGKSIVEVCIPCSCNCWQFIFERFAVCLAPEVFGGYNAHALLIDCGGQFFASKFAEFLSSFYDKRRTGMGCEITGDDLLQQVPKRMEGNGWMSTSGVRVIKGRWDNAVHLLSKEIAVGAVSHFDGIFFDTCLEGDLDPREFHSWLPTLLRLSEEPAESEEAEAEAGRYSYYNDIWTAGVFFHGVACEAVRLHMKW
ncbi:unnamed protein product [Calicophoron daubneyi]|uniref:Uncharacterized protein n=1 Tax=Calicophoron daubneyi TaxID=300641 RepID=A0AAV2TH59_CALDB